MSDVALVTVDPIYDQLGTLIPLLRHILMNQHVNLDCKLRAIETLGDISMVVDAAIVPHLPEMMDSLS